MKLPKAIEILTLSLTTRPSIKDPDFDKALKLGIEALRRIQDGREKGYDYFGHLLEGETQE